MSGLLAFSSLFLLLKQVRHLDTDLMYSLLIHISFYARCPTSANTVDGCTTICKQPQSETHRLRSQLNDPN
jgi:hypothetical protein